MLLEILCIFANLFSLFFNHKNTHPLFLLHVSTSGTVNNIKIICSIRFSLLITIDRFYKLFSCRGCFCIMTHLRRSPRSFSYRSPHPTSAPSGHLLPKEGGSIHASPFPWKGLPSAARRGWLPFFAAKPPPLCLPH